MSITPTRKQTRLIWPVTWLICMTTKTLATLWPKDPKNVSIKSQVNKDRATEIELELFIVI